MHEIDAVSVSCNISLSIIMKYNGYSILMNVTFVIDV